MEDRTFLADVLTQPRACGHANDRPFD